MACSIGRDHSRVFSSTSSVGCILVIVWPSSGGLDAHAAIRRASGAPLIDRCFVVASSEVGSWAAAPARVTFAPYLGRHGHRLVHRSPHHHAVLLRPIPPTP